MFPQGGPGVGLLLLRIAVAATFALNLTHRFNLSSNALSWLITALIGLTSLGLLLGFLTPILSIVACIASVLSLILIDQSNTAHIFRLLTSAALFFLGPGAYSVDAKRFGLKVTVVPPRKNKNSI